MWREAAPIVLSSHRPSQTMCELMKLSPESGATYLDLDDIHTNIHSNVTWIMRNMQRQTQATNTAQSECGPYSADTRHWWYLQVRPSQWPAQAVQCSPARPAQTRPRQQRRREHGDNIILSSHMIIRIVWLLSLDTLLSPCLLMSAPRGPWYLWSLVVVTWPGWPSPLCPALPSAGVC